MKFYRLKTLGRAGITLALIATALSGFAAEVNLPALPSGLPGGSSGGLPPLPQISSGVSAALNEVDDKNSPWSVHGFTELRSGLRLQEDDYQGGASISEARAQLELDYSAVSFSGRLRSDLIIDPELRESDVALDQGTGAIDLREAWLQRVVSDWLEVKAGRQVLTWGVGDQLFINDLFPKDWNSFFIGRDLEYLKAPSDAVKLAFYFDAVNLDLVYTPEFDSDRYIDGRRNSFYNPTLGRLSGSDAIVEVLKPDGSELALRLYKNVAGVELALYGYDGYWKSPNSFDAASGLATFPRLQVVGASLRGNLAGGVFSAEIGNYVSRDDRQGNRALIANGELRLLLGYERELAANTTIAFQYYLERMTDYRAYRDNLPSSMLRRDENRHVLTTRFTRQTMNQTLTWSVFAFVSPSDKDWFLQPNVSYKYSDRLLLTAGMNLFDGDDSRTFFAQFNDNSNAYVGIRYSF